MAEAGGAFKHMGLGRGCAGDAHAFLRGGHNQGLLGLNAGHARLPAEVCPCLASCGDQQGFFYSALCCTQAPQQDGRGRVCFQAHAFG